MKNNKMVLWFVLMVMSVIPVYGQQYNSESDFKIDWDKNVKDGVIITSYIGTKKEVRIPPRIQNYLVTGLGFYTFEGNENITSITIPNGVAEFYFYTFRGCSNLTAINVDAQNNSFSSTDGVLYNKNKTVLFRYPGGRPGAFTIPNGVTEIWDGAFMGCASLTGITIPDSVTDLCGGAFSGCSKLTKVTIGKGVTNLAWVFDTDYGAFSDCVSLTTINIPDNVTIIDSYAFSGCTSLASINIPDRVTRIGYGAFKGCTSLTGINIPNSVTSIENNAFADCTNLTSVTFEGKIAADNLSKWGDPPFPGDLKDKYLARDGGPGTYRRLAGGNTWRKQ